MTTAPRTAPNATIAGATLRAGCMVPGSSRGVEIGKAIDDHLKERDRRGGFLARVAEYPFQIKPVARAGKRRGRGGDHVMLRGSGRSVRRGGPGVEETGMVHAR